MTIKDKKTIGVEGLKLGLKAFIITYILAFVIAVVVNISIIENVQDYLLGSLVEGVGFNFGLVIKTTVLIMNVSVFNSSGAIKIGLLIFVALPFFAFFMADRTDNSREGMNLAGFMTYGIASLIYALLLMLLSLIGKGTYLGVAISFVSLRNIIMTFLITFLIQVAIGMNYDTYKLPGILATRWMVRMVFGFTIVVSIIAMVVGLIRYTTNPMLIIFAIILFVPNVAIYLMFTMMGISLDFNGELDQLFNYGQIDLAYSAIPVGIRIGLMAIFIVTIFISIYKLNEKAYVKGLIGFAIYFPLICLLAALCTSVNLGAVKFIGSVRFGIDYRQALLYPFVAIVGMGIFDLAIKRMFKVIKEG